MTDKENEVPGYKRFICPEGKSEFSEKLSAEDFELYLKKSRFFHFKGRKSIAYPGPGQYELEEWEIPDPTTKKARDKLNLAMNNMNEALEIHIKEEIKNRLIEEKIKIDKEVREKYKLLEIKLEIEENLIS